MDRNGNTSGDWVRCVMVSIFPFLFTASVNSLLFSLHRKIQMNFCFPFYNDLTIGLQGKDFVKTTKRKRQTKGVSRSLPAKKKKALFFFFQLLFGFLLESENEKKLKITKKVPLECNRRSFKKVRFFDVRTGMSFIQAFVFFFSGGLCCCVRKRKTKTNRPIIKTGSTDHFFCFIFICKFCQANGASESLISNFIHFKWKMICVQNCHVIGNVRASHRNDSCFFFHPSTVIAANLYQRRRWLIVTPLIVTCSG